MTHLRKLVVVMSFALASTFITAAPAQAYTSYPNYTNRATYAARVTYDLNVIRSQHGLGQFTPTYCPLWFATKWAPPTHLRVRSARENAPVDALVAGTPCHGFELSAASPGAL
jgi:hypothetical protein